MADQREYAGECEDMPFAAAPVESMRPVSEIGETFPPENSMWKGRRGTSVDEDCQLWSAMRAR